MRFVINAYVQEKCVIHDYFKKEFYIIKPHKNGVKDFGYDKWFVKEQVDYSNCEIMLCRMDDIDGVYHRVTRNEKLNNTKDRDSIGFAIYTKTLLNGEGLYFYIGVNNSFDSICYNLDLCINSNFGINIIFDTEEKIIMSQESFIDGKEVSLYINSFSLCRKQE